MANSIFDESEPQLVSLPIPDQWPIGTKFRPLGTRYKDPIEVVVDIYTTTNSKGEVVRTRYIAEHEFCGQQVRNEFTKTTISRAIFAR